MERRNFLKLTGLLAATAGALEILPAGAQGIVTWPDQEPAGEAALRAPGVYQITGRVRLLEPVVEISGITNAQQISWSGLGDANAPVAPFSSFESFDRPWRMPEIRVRGGTLEAVSVAPVTFA
jgi:hypothetical protein